MEALTSGVLLSNSHSFAILWSSPLLTSHHSHPHVCPQTAPAETCLDLFGLMKAEITEYEPLAFFYVQSFFTTHSIQLLVFTNTLPGAKLGSHICFEQYSCTVHYCFIPYVVLEYGTSGTDVDGRLSECRLHSSWHIQKNEDIIENRECHIHKLPINVCSNHFGLNWLLRLPWSVSFCYTVPESIVWREFIVFLLCCHNSRSSFCWHEEVCWRWQGSHVYYANWITFGG